MNRRDFLLATAAAGVAAATTGCAGPEVRGAEPTRPRNRQALMKVGCQRYGGRSDENLQYYARHGVDHIDSSPDGPWTAENIKKVRKRAEAYGITVEAAHVSIGSIWEDDREKRDRMIDDFCNIIRTGADGGYSALLYNLKIPCGAPHRTGQTPGRGRVNYPAFEFAKVSSEPKVDKPVSSQKMWDATTYFLERVVPVAEKCKIRVACHPEDPPFPPGFRGTPHILASVEGLKRFVSIADSDYHGLNFCQGTVSEMLEDPGKEVFDIIRWFGLRKKIHNVHFRNIRGRHNDFCEVYPDEGDIDMLRAMRVYKEVGYAGMIMPDHVPSHPDDPQQRESFAFGYGYTRALIQAVAAEG